MCYIVLLFQPESIVLFGSSDFFVVGDELYATSAEANPSFTGTFLNPRGTSKEMRVGLKVKSYMGRPSPLDGFDFNVVVKDVEDTIVFDDVITVYCYGDSYVEGSLDIPVLLDAGEYTVTFTWINQEAGSAIQVAEYYLKSSRRIMTCRCEAHRLATCVHILSSAY